MSTKQLFRNYNLGIIKRIVGNVRFELNPKLDPRNEVYDKPSQSLMIEKIFQSA